MPEQDSGTRMLLESLLQTQQLLASELRDAMKVMATKSDIASLSADLKDTVSRSEYETLRKQVDSCIPRHEIEGRMADFRKEYETHITWSEKQQEFLDRKIQLLEQDKLPKWFWPALAAFLSLVTPIVGVIVTHILKWG